MIYKSLPNGHGYKSWVVGVGNDKKLIFTHN